jgi:amino acid adenylation domain-containing protein
VNTLPLIVETKEEETLADLDQEIAAKLFRLHRHQNFDLAQIANMSPRFSCLFTVYPQELGLDLTECECVSIPIRRDHFPSEIRLTVEMRRSEYRLVFDLGTYFDHINVGDAYQSTLAAVMNDLDATVGSIDFMPARQGKVELIGDVTMRIEQHHGGVAEAFERVVRGQPNLTAICFADERWTYDQLNVMANKMARVLAQRAGGSREVVLAVERSHHAIALVLAVLKAGKCYVPLDPHLPADRRMAILEELEHPFIVGPPEVRNKAIGIELGELLAECENLPENNLELVLAVSLEAYMIYTSGSTGTPKGVALTHSNLMSLMIAAGAEFEFSKRDVWTLFHSFSFDYSIWEMFGCLLHGGRLIIVDFPTTQDIASYVSLLNRERVTIINQTPTVFKHLIREDARAKNRLSPRMVFLGGEALNFPLLKGWTELHPFPECRLINLYGPTECTVLVTFHELCSADLEQQRSIVGKPIASSIVEIRTSTGVVAPCGVPGEITISGLGVAPKGYFKRPSESAQRFFSSADGVSFRTGDIGRVGADGNIDFLGRMDRQIKVRGFRVEAGDVEAALLRNPKVRECAVGIQATQMGGDGVLVAYVVLSDNQYTADSLRKFARTQLAAYMVPSAFIVTDQIPTMLSGKVDFDSLADVTKMPPVVKGLTPTEQWLFGLVALKLGHSDFDVTDNLLDAGLTSLAAVDLVGTVHERFGDMSLTITDLFEFSTIKAVSARLNNAPEASLHESHVRERAVARQALLTRRYPSRRGSSEAHGK